MVRKISAAREVWEHMFGTIDTPEKYEAHRDVMRDREVARMVASDSAECRNCHDSSQWLLADQGRQARRKHGSMVEDGKTCINCHDDVAHPREEDDDGLFGL